MKISNQKNDKMEKIVCAIMFAFVPIFFIILYMLMTGTYEDIAQRSYHIGSDIPTILKETYSYIPRLGEFYQRIAIHFMDAQTQFGVGMVFRLLLGLIAWGLIYGLTFFILKRRPKLNYTDALLHSGLFIVIMISPMSDFFLFKFSYAHNYVLSATVAIFFLTIHRVQSQRRKKILIPIGFMLGFLFAISNELSPIAYLLIVIPYISFKITKRRLSAKTLTRHYPVQLFAFLGVICGMFFFHLSASVHNRANGAYGQIYDYISIMDVFRAPIYTLASLYKHLWYNMRYLWWLIPLIMTTIGVTYILSKKRLTKKTWSKDALFWQIILLAFSALYMGGGSIIAAHDDIYIRFFSIMLIALLLIWVILIEQLLPFFAKNGRLLVASVVFLNFILTLMILDMSLYFSKYRGEVRADVEKIQLIDHDAPRMPEGIDPSLLTMKPSFFFRWQQANPFNWYVKDRYYLKNGLDIELPK